MFTVTQRIARHDELNDVGVIYCFFFNKFNGQRVQRKQYFLIHNDNYIPKKIIIISFD